MAERGRSLEGCVLNPILQKFPCQETVLQVSTCSLKSSFWQLFLFPAAAIIIYKIMELLLCLYKIKGIVKHIRTNVFKEEVELPKTV